MVTSQAVLPERFGLLMFCALMGFVAGGIRGARREPTGRLPLADILVQALGAALTSFLAALVAFEYWGPGRTNSIVAGSTLCGWVGWTLLDQAGGLVQTLSRFLTRSILDRWAQNKEPGPPGGTP